MVARVARARISVGGPREAKGASKRRGKSGRASGGPRRQLGRGFSVDGGGMAGGEEDEVEDEDEVEVVDVVVGWTRGKSRQPKSKSALAQASQASQPSQPTQDNRLNVT